MDYIAKLLKTQAKILISHLIPMVTTIIAFGIVELFMREILRYDGIPREIINDKDCKFTSDFWTTFFKLCETKIKLSTSYHLETHGQIEQTNRILKDMLRMYVDKKQHSRDK